MDHNHTSSEIQKGLWLIAPQLASRYLHASSKIVDGSASNIKQSEPNAGFVREIIDSDGNLINIHQQDIPENSIGIVRCIGPMYKYGGWFNWGTDELLAIMEDFERNPSIIGQIWRDDSGGGTVSSVPEYLHFLKKKTKPVVSLLDMSASANYWKNCNTDYVMAENDISAVFGSIGVMLQFYDYSKMLEEMGIIEHIVNADQSEDKNKAFELALKGQYDLIKAEMLNPLAIKFQDYVKAARPKLKTDNGTLTGKMFYAEEALDRNMIDAIGSMEAAIDQVKFLASARSFISTHF